MRSALIAAALSIALTVPAFAGDGWHHHYGGGGGWWWGAPLAAGAVLGATGAILAAPYYYAPPYTYAYGPYAAPAYPTPRQCPNGYGGWFWC